MSESLPRSVSSTLHFDNGSALGISNRWIEGQYCSILTPVGIVGCGIYDVVVPAKFNQALAIAEGTPESVSKKKKSYTGQYLKPLLENT